MKTIKKFCALVVCALASLPSLAQQSVLGSVTLCNYRHNSKDVTICMYGCTFLGFQTDGIVDWLVANNCIRRNVNEADWLRGGNDCCDILIDGKLLHFQIRLLCKGWEGG